jgi:hypothetical protein
MLTGIDYIMNMGDIHMYKTDDEIKAELVYTALGAASVCWYRMPEGVFDNERCLEIGKELIMALDLLYNKHGRR